MSDMAAVSGKRNAGAGLKGRAVELGNSLFIESITTWSNSII